MQKLVFLLILIVSLQVDSKVEKESWVLDSRFAALDIKQMIQKNYPHLSQQAELISHYSGYYSINPFILAEVLHTSKSSNVIEQAKYFAKELKISQNKTTETDHSILVSEKIKQTAHQLMNKYGIPLFNSRSMDDPIAPVFDLPFNHEESWHFNGVHTWNGEDNGAAMSSIDLTKSWGIGWGSDTSNDWVTASTDGMITVFSSCYLRVTHESGWATDYYHLDNI